MCVFVFGICIIAQPCEKVVEWRKLREVKRSARKEILNLVANHGTIEMPCKLKEQKVVSDRERKELERATRLYEEREYQALVADVAHDTDRQNGVEDDMKVAKQHMSMGMNVIIGMATAFVAGYYFARSYGNTVATISGALCMSIVMIAEIMLFMIRGSREDAWNEKKKAREG
mmetsp:Transcript_48065/g.124868  ORF Transcript_48065/g.124868 Transcript_48065/m.124868 type:complete len:173 (+) Transcript_48065:121-639(+)